MPLLRSMLSRRWIFTSVLVFAATLVLIRLGFWQLDRLAGRRAFNAQVTSALAMPALNLNQDLPDEIETMEWRAVRVTGTYDFDHQFALRNRYHQDQLGYHLITPLLFSGTAVLIDRGWIPAEGNDSPASWHTYDESGEATVAGQIRLGLDKPAFGGIEDPPALEGETLFLWNNLDLRRIANQIPYPVVPVLIQPDMDANDLTPPIPYQPEQDLTEGSHFGYALQWFTFAAILFFGYPFYLQKQEKA